MASGKIACIIVIYILNCEVLASNDANAVFHNQSRVTKVYAYKKLKNLVCSLPEGKTSLRFLADALVSRDLHTRIAMSNPSKSADTDQNESMITKGNLAATKTFKNEPIQNAEKWKEIDSRYSNDTKSLEHLFMLMENKINRNIARDIDLQYLQHRFLCYMHDKKSRFRRTQRAGRFVNSKIGTNCLPYWLGDGFCDLGCNSIEFNYDNGDCCYKTCIAKVRRYPCGYTGFQCASESSDVPSWFQNMNLCFKWRATGDAKQCDLKRRGKLCAPVGSMTRFYHDNTDQRSGGCRLSWKMEAKDVPVWMQNKLQLCLGNYAEGDPYQCNNGRTNMQMCRPLNRWLHYMDDTDDREGGCYLTWKLHYQGILPSWAKKIQFCFYWHSFNNQCSILGKQNHQLCSGINEWTISYKDNTDRRKNGCEMAWGILM